MSWQSIWRLATAEMVHGLPGRGDSWLDFQGCEATAEAVEQDFSLGEIPHRAAIAAAIAAWTTSGEWPSMPDPARHCIRLRLSAAALFLFLHFEAGPDFLPLPPGRSEREILGWLLTAWWDARGRRFFSEGKCVRRESAGESGES